jgi:hypothetical protein
VPSIVAQNFIDGLTIDSALEEGLAETTLWFQHGMDLLSYSALRRGYER